MIELRYDPMEGGSPQEQARLRAAMDQEFGMPRQPYTGEIGRLVNQLHFENDAAMNDEFGWGNTTREQLRRRWDL